MAKSGANAFTNLTTAPTRTPASGEFNSAWNSVEPTSSKPTAIGSLEQVEISTIRRVLDACAGNVSLASKQLNISRNTIYRKLNRGT